MTAGVLSQREREVADLLVNGLLNKQIAAFLGIGIQTVKQHVHSACEKLGFKNRVQLAIWASKQVAP